MTLVVLLLLLILVVLVVLLRELAEVVLKLGMALTDRAAGEFVVPQLPHGRIRDRGRLLSDIQAINTCTNLAQESDRLLEGPRGRDLQHIVVEDDSACGAKFTRDLSLRATGESTPSQQDGHAFSKSTALFQSQTKKYGTVSFRG